MGNHLMKNKRANALEFGTNVYYVSTMTNCNGVIYAPKQLSNNQQESETFIYDDNLMSLQATLNH